MVNLAVRVAPLDDEELLGVVQDAFRQIIIPELERAGAEEFVVSQVRSCLSIVGLVRKGLAERIVGREQAEQDLTELLNLHDIAPAAARSPYALGELLATPGRPELGRRLRELLNERLELEIETRTKTEERA